MRARLTPRATDEYPWPLHRHQCQPIEQRRVDQVYTFKDTLYTYDNSGSLGGSFTCKRFLVDTSGNTNIFIDGTLFWDVIPTGTNVAPILCAGHFTLGQPIPGAAIPAAKGD